MKISQIIVILFSSWIFMSGCGNDNVDDPRFDDAVYDPTAHEIIIPEKFPQLEIPEDNLTTKEGVELGRRLYYTLSSTKKVTGLARLVTFKRIPSLRTVPCYHI